LWLAGRLRAGIFVNKAGCSSYADLVVWHATRRSFPSSSSVLPWRKAQEEISGAGSVNKCRFFLVRDLDAVMIPLAGHGGEGGRQTVQMVSRSGGCWGCSSLHPGVHHMAVTFCCHDSWLKRQPLQTPMASIQPPRRRPFEEFLPAFKALAAPSGCVPGAGKGGRRWNSCYGGEEEGPNCFSCNLCRVFSVKFEDCFVLFFFSGILCILYPHRQK
jgi:hypothetical protein